jgi:uncharacterized protein (DUF1499 family)
MARVWQSLFGSPDLGPVDFATLKRRTTPNDSLACSRGLCPRATPDIEPPVYPLAAERLRAIAREAILAEPDVMLVQSDGLQDRYVVRTRLLRFPDTVDVKVVDVAENRSTLALYSRSQVGRSDLGTNGRRLGRWVARISRLAAAERPGSGR